jgi:ribosomal protein S18 acetylase RimI-like enzyme
MIAIEPITRHTALLFKSARLRALADTPSAFGSTYGREVQLTDAQWLERTAQWTDQWTHHGSTIFLAIDGSIACGVAGSFLQPDDPARAQLVSMWTAPTHRRRGIGRLLVDRVMAWARSRHSRTLSLNVTSNNQPAIWFYERLGFTPTGHTQPYGNDPALLEYEMSRPIF